MKKLKIGILREERIPNDRRVALLPSQCLQVMSQYPVQIVVQPSHVRCYTNKEYVKAGIRLQEDLADCDVLIGIKEVPTHLLIPNKTYLFFSHTIKKQAHNKKLLQTILQNNIRLIDYEALIDADGNRIIAFGRYAGIVGAYNALLMYGKRFKLFQLKRAYECFDFEDLKNELKKIVLPPIRIAITGGGRVAAGVIEILNLLQIKQVSPIDFKMVDNAELIFTQLHSSDYYHSKDNEPYSRADFFNNPSSYESHFSEYFPFADILIASAYWNPSAPALFSLDHIKQPDFNIKIIADITCDIGGSIPSTIRPSTIDNPAYDFNRYTGLLEPPFSDDKNITVMAIDNLPGELPRFASEGFGKQMMDTVLPQLLTNDFSGNLRSGIVAQDGSLKQRFSYLQDFVE